MSSPDLSSIFAALADPTRRAILAQLVDGDAPVKELAAPFAMSGPAITKHLHVLETAGLISRRRDGQLRPCRLEPEGFAPAADFIESYRTMWSERFDRLEGFLKSVAPSDVAVVGKTTSGVEKKRKSKTSARKEPPTKPTKGKRRGRKN